MIKNVKAGQAYRVSLPGYQEKGYHVEISNLPIHCGLILSNWHVKDESARPSPLTLLYV